MQYLVSVKLLEVQCLQYISNNGTSKWKYFHKITFYAKTCKTLILIFLSRFQTFFETNSCNPQFRHRASEKRMLQQILFQHLLSAFQRVFAAQEIPLPPLRPRGRFSRRRAESLMWLLVLSASSFCLSAFPSFLFHGINPFVIRKNIFIFSIYI